MKLYISGPASMVGSLAAPAFNDAEAVLVAAGFEVINPIRHGFGDGRTWQDYMRLAAHDIADSDGVATLPHWSLSRGSLVEVTLAGGLRLPVKTVGEWTA